MHTLNRFLVLCLTLLVLVPAGTYAVVSLEERDKVADSLQSAIDSAAQRYRRRNTLQVKQSNGERTLDAQAKTLQTLAQQKRAMRQEILALRNTIEKLQVRYALELSNAGMAKEWLEQGKDVFSGVVRDAYRERLSSDISAHDARRQWMQHVLRQPILGDASHILAAYIRFLRDMLTAQKTHERLQALQQDYAQLLTQHASAQQKYATAEASVELNAEQIEEIKAIMHEVHEQVLKLQGELARIDVRLRAKAERALVQKGLMDPEDIAKKEARTLRPALNWPAYGTVSAGFHNANYKKYFGVPHEGMDIVIPQETPVYSAADGIVSLVRDGGAKGYTYVLIGHRNGYATLYGHLSAVSVVAGQEVGVGQAIGLSGGRPGTPGSGPMTTGPHLHFEVIQNGVNVDPKTVLP